MRRTVHCFVPCRCTLPQAQPALLLGSVSLAGLIRHCLYTRGAAQCITLCLACISKCLHCTVTGPPIPKLTSIPTGRVTWHFPAAGFLGVLAMSGLTSLIWQRSSMSRLCDQIAPGKYKRAVVRDIICSRFGVDYWHICGPCFASLHWLQ